MKIYIWNFSVAQKLWILELFLQNFLLRRQILHWYFHTYEILPPPFSNATYGPDKGRQRGWTHLRSRRHSCKSKFYNNKSGESEYRTHLADSYRVDLKNFPASFNQEANCKPYKYVTKLTSHCKKWETDTCPDISGYLSSYFWIFVLLIFVHLFLD